MHPACCHLHPGFQAAWRKAMVAGHFDVAFELNDRVDMHPLQALRECQWRTSQLLAMVGIFRN